MVSIDAWPHQTVKQLREWSLTMSRFLEALKTAWVKVNKAVNLIQKLTSAGLFSCLLFDCLLDYWFWLYWHLHWSVFSFKLGKYIPTSKNRRVSWWDIFLPRCNRALTRYPFFLPRVHLGRLLHIMTKLPHATTKAPHIKKKLKYCIWLQKDRIRLQKYHI